MSIKLFSVGRMSAFHYSRTGRAPLAHNVGADDLQRRSLKPDAMVNINTLRRHMLHGVAAFAVAATLSLASHAAAATFVFSETRANVNVVDPPGTGRCAPMNTVRIEPGRLSSTGISNFGAFASTQSHCIAGPPSPANPVQITSLGEARYEFAAGDTLFATFSGTVTLAGGVITGIENLVANGGTGRFLGATGSWQAIGPLSFIPNPQGGFLGVYNGRFEGTLNLPAVPEPATWALFIAGFGLVGARLRRHRPAAA